MEASDLIKHLTTNLARRGSSTYGPIVLKNPEIGLIENQAETPV